MSEEEATKHLSAAQYFYNIAKELQENGKFDDAERYFLKAIRYYEKATKIEPSRKDIWEKTGDIYVHFSKFEAAIKPYKEALTLDPNNVELLRKLATAYYSAAKHEVILSSTKRNYYLELIRLLHKYLHASPSDTGAWITLGDAHQFLEDYEQAQLCYDKALELRPNHSETLENAARNQLLMKNYENAVKLFEQDRKARPESHVPLLNLARFYEETGNFRKAIDYMKNAMEKEPNIPELWERLEDYYAHLGAYESAKECRNKAIEIRHKRKEQET